MIRTALAALAFVAIFSSLAHAQEPRVVDGTCPQTANEILSELQSDLDHANAIASSRHCVPLTSAARPAAETRELAQLESGYHDWVKKICTEKLCLSNEWAALLDLHRGVSDFWVAQNVFAGCLDWADRGSTKLMNDDLQYWALREVKVDNMSFEMPTYGKKPDNYHWVVEVENTRTHERFYLDGWRAAAAARPWMQMAVVPTEPEKIDPKNEVYDEKFENDWGDISYRSPLLNPKSLCNPPV